MNKKIIRKKLLWLPVLTCLFFILFPTCAPRHNEIRIGIIGDQFGADDPNKAYTIMGLAAQKLKKQHPDIVLHTGDMVESIRNIDDFDDYQALFIRASGIMESFGVPWMVAIGDHDVNPPRFAPPSQELSRLQWFMDLAHKTTLPIDSLPYYSFDCKNYHFISLFSLENLHTDPRWGSIFLNKITDQQIRWLEKDLQQHRNALGTIVIVHQPHWYSWSNWYLVHQILAKYQVLAVIAGHLHYDQDDGTIDGIRYFVMGATGGIIKDSDSHSGGVQEYAWLDIDRDKHIQIQLHSVESDESLELTPRRSMDRIQAIAYMLDNLRNDVNLFWKDGQLYSREHDEEKLAQSIGLESIGNPIDVPIRISVTASEVVSSAQWVMEDSAKNPSDQDIVLSPGKRIDWANYANVGQWSPQPELWKGAVNLEALQKTQQIALTVTIRFTDNRERYIRSNIIYQVR